VPLTTQRTVNGFPTNSTDADESAVPPSRHLTASAPACAIWASSFESTPDTPMPPAILPSNAIVMPPFINEHLEDIHHACKLGLEGIVSKRKDSRYRSGRSPYWIKSKNPSAPAVLREAEEDWGR
jgi:hypothetical protein